MKIAFSDRPISIHELACHAGGVLMTRGENPPTSVDGLCTDSREADGRTILCAIRGERVDGHRFLPGAARAGCVAFLCEQLPEGWGDTSSDSSMGSVSAAAIVVPDTVEAFSRLAQARRTEVLSDLHITAVTGSVGKTTTKEMIAAVLGERYRLFKKEGNFNSTIGLPLSCLEIPVGTEVAVLEMGMSARGEIAVMTEAVRPDIAIVANVGTSHLEHLGTRENIARAKLEIARGIRSGGTLLINGDEPLLAALGQNFNEDPPIIPADIAVRRVSLHAASDADYIAESITVCNGGMRFDLRAPDGIRNDLWIPAIGTHLVWAAAFAAVVGLLHGMDEAAIRAGLAAYRPAAMRQSIRQVAGITFIEDCYNAAPESMRAALEVLKLVAGAGYVPFGGVERRVSVQTPPRRRIAVLGDMRELGADTIALHTAVGTEVARLGVDLLVTVGSLGAHIAAGARKAGLADDRILVTAADAVEPSELYPSIADRLIGRLWPGDCILFKASRAMTMETLAAELGKRLAK